MQNIKHLYSTPTAKKREFLLALRLVAIIVLIASTILFIFNGLFYESVFTAITSTNIIFISFVLIYISFQKQILLHDPFLILCLHTFIFYGIACYSSLSLLENNIITEHEYNLLPNALIYTYICVLFFFFGFTFSNKGEKKFRYLIEIKEDRLMSFILFILFFSIIGKIFQIYSGNYFHTLNELYDKENLVRVNPSSLLSQFANIFMTFNKMIYFLIYVVGYFAFRSDNKKYLYILYGIVLLEVLFNLPSGSKQRVIEPIISYLLIRSFYKEVPQKFIIILFISYIFIITPFVTLYRSSGLGFESFYSYYLSDSTELSSDKKETVSNQVISRINYIIVVVRIMNKHQYENYSFLYGETYTRGLKMLIPRIIWPEKPVDNSGNDFGHEYGFLNENDYQTFVGKYWIGESFMNFSYFGVLIAFMVGSSLGYLYMLTNQNKEQIIIIIFIQTLISFITTDELIFYIFFLIRDFMLNILIIMPFLNIKYLNQNK